MTKILLIWYGSEIPEEYVYCFKTLERHAKHLFKIEVLVDRPRELFKEHKQILISDFLNSKELEFTNKLERVTHLSDILRFKWLSLNDGIYFDIDTIHFKSPYYLFSEGKQKLTLVPEFSTNVCTGIVGSSDRDLFRYLFEISMNYPIKSYFDYYYRLYNKVIDLKYGFTNYYNELGVKNNDVVILPNCSYIKYNYEIQCLMWSSKDKARVDLMMDQLLNSKNIYGFTLMSDQTKKSSFRSKYVIDFIKRNKLA